MKIIKMPEASVETLYFGVPGKVQYSVGLMEKSNFPLGVKFNNPVYIKEYDVTMHGVLPVGINKEGHIIFYIDWMEQGDVAVEEILYAHLRKENE